jgi:tRNA (guanine37-N1)-methyltransferase
LPAHFNLREEHEEFKKIIGQVILDKNRTLRTVVNKANTIDDTYRTFQMEVVAGEPDMLAEMRESSCTFRFDFSKVYWNSRLQGEHDRIIRMFQPGQYICEIGDNSGSTLHGF